MARSAMMNSLISIVGNNQAMSAGDFHCLFNGHAIVNPASALPPNSQKASPGRGIFAMIRLHCGENVI